MDYNELVEHIKTFESDKEKLEALSQFILDNVSYNYETLCHSKVCKYLRSNDPDMKIDFNNRTQAIQFICELSKQLKLTEKYQNDMLSLYGYYAKLGDVSFIDIMPVATSPAEYKDKVLKLGVCEQISQFFKQVCTDVGISCNVVRGNTGFAHAWNVAFCDGEYKHYDCTYAIYSKDKYAGWDKKTTPNDWLGVTEKRLQQLHPERIINKIM